MKKCLAVVLLLVACALAGFGKEPQFEKATNVLDEIMETPDKGIPRDLLNRSVCVGIVPSELQAAFMLGGTYGRGVLMCRRNGNGRWGAPSRFTLGGGSFGFQLGAKATDVVFLVMNEGGARKFIHDKVKLGADASATAGPVGRTAEAATDAQLHAEILGYSRTRGLFAGISLSGAFVKQDRGENRRVYGHDFNAQEILFGTVPIPVAAEPLHAALEKFSPHGGRAYTTASLSK